MSFLHTFYMFQNKLFGTKFLKQVFQNINDSFRDELSETTLPFLFFLLFKSATMENISVGRGGNDGGSGNDRGHGTAKCITKGILVF